MSGPRRPTRGPAIAALLLVAALGACGRDPSPPVVAAAHPAAAAAAAVLAAVDANDAGRFAALSADRKDRDARPARPDDVRSTVQDLHERFGLRARTVAAPVVARDEGGDTGGDTGGPTEADVDVVLEGGAAMLTLTLRRSADGAWRVVGLSESAAPMEDGGPTNGPVAAPHAPDAPQK